MSAESMMLTRERGMLLAWSCCLLGSLHFALDMAQGSVLEGGWGSMGCVASSIRVCNNFRPVAKGNKHTEGCVQVQVADRARLPAGQDTEICDAHQRLQNCACLGCFKQ